MLSCIHSKLLIKMFSQFKLVVHEICDAEIVHHYDGKITTSRVTACWEVVSDNIEVALANGKVA